MPQVSTHLMFQGNASDAIDTYSSIFSDFNVENIEKYGEDEQGEPDTIKQAYVSFAGHKLIVIDSPPVHEFDFTPSMSLFIDFENEEALESAFARLSEAGNTMMPLNDYGFSKRFGWLSDKFGVSWQLNLPYD
ncbi:MAG: VOC family protein [Rhizobiaceae bacterium]